MYANIFRRTWLYFSQKAWSWASLIQTLKAFSIQKGRSLLDEMKHNSTSLDKEGTSGAMAVFIRDFYIKMGDLCTKYLHEQWQKRPYSLDTRHGHSTECNPCLKKVSTLVDSGREVLGDNITRPRGGLGEWWGPHVLGYFSKRENQHVCWTRPFWWRHRDQARLKVQKWSEKLSDVEMTCRDQHSWILQEQM